MSAFELELTVCAGGKGHVTTTVEVATAAELESLAETTSAAIKSWQDEREQASDPAGSEAALEIALRYGGIDGAHHKTWVIDQMVRALTGDDYERTIAAACEGEDGPNTYTWSAGIAP